MKYFAILLLSASALVFSSEAQAQSADCSDVCIACCGGSVDGPSAIVRLFQKASQKAAKKIAPKAESKLQVPTTEPKNMLKLPSLKMPF